MAVSVARGIVAGGIVLPEINRRAHRRMAQQIPSILTTKLFVVRPQANLVPREGLLRKLDELPRRKLALVSAPAGFGKTTSIAAWIQAHRYPVAWVSLDAGDSDPARFLAYLVAALRTLHPEVGESVQQALAATPVPPAELLLAALINDLASVPDDFLLVLDDYHAIESPEVHEILLFILERAPASLHLVLLTRADPPFPLARLRVRGELLEVRAADLRFSGGEAARFFNDLMGLDLSGEQLAALQAKTEGWAAGLQMAALSLQGRSDVEGFIEAFTGADRFVLDYLLEETLALLPEDLQRVMPELSILGRFNASLCEAVTRRDSGSELLAELERRNLFLVPLDNHREWYRYHHLFADLLGHRLQGLYPESVPELHRRASLWYESQGEMYEAIAHAREAGDAGLLARLVESSWRDLIRQGGRRELWELTSGIAPGTVLARPRLAVMHGWAHTYYGRLDEAGDALDAVEQRLEEEPDDPCGEELTGIVWLLRAVIARERGDSSCTIELAERALELLPDHHPSSLDYMWNTSHAMVLSLLGTAYHREGESLQAEAAFERSLRHGRTNNDLYSVLIALSNLGREELQLGRLGRAEAIADEIGQRNGTADISIPDLLMTPHQIRARVLLERYELDAAREAARAARDLCDPGQHRQLKEIYRLLFAIEDAARNWEEAEAMLGAFDSPHGPESPSPVAAMLRARLAVRRDDTATAASWGEKRFQGERDERELGYFNARAEELLHARILLREKRYDQAERLLGSLQGAFESGGLLPMLLETLVLRVVLLQETGRGEEAFEILAHALKLGAPERFIRPFVYDAEPVARLMAHYQKRVVMLGTKISSAYLRKVIDLCGMPLAQEAMPANGLSGMPEGIIPLTSRELEILQLMSQGYSNQKIADKLYVSINTIKTHISNLFDKLEVRSRVEALARARDAKII